jgi:small-conductance mechanosensitive channel
MGIIVLCLLSMLAFCFSAHVVLKAFFKPHVPRWALPGTQAKYSVSARRIATAYSIFAMTALMIVAAIGSVASFIELFAVGVKL